MEVSGKREKQMWGPAKLREARPRKPPRTPDTWCGHRYGEGACFQLGARTDP